MRLRAYKGKPETQTLEIMPPVHGDISLAFEFALFRLQHTQDSTHDILNDYLREVGA